MKDQPFLNDKSWEYPVPAPRLDFGHEPLHFETTFWELRPGRLAPINTRTAVGVPDRPVGRARPDSLGTNLSLPTDRGSSLVG